MSGNAMMKIVVFIFLLVGTLPGAWSSDLGAEVAAVDNGLVYYFTSASDRERFLAQSTHAEIWDQAAAQRNLALGRLVAVKPASQDSGLIGARDNNARLVAKADAIWQRVMDRRIAFALR
ncbi:MAG: hypothetical protein U1F68_03935 [Gammaproteobacteria bacterium]